MSHQRRRAAVSALLALLMSTMGIGPAAATDPVTVRVAIGDRCVSGLKPPGDLVKLVLWTGAGTYLGSQEDASSDGSYAFCFAHRVKAGYRITITDGDASRRVTVPDLTIAADRITDVVSGRGPASKHVTILFSDCSLTGCAGFSSVDRTVDGQGRYRRDLTSHLDLQGADRLALTYTDGHGDVFDTPQEHVPYLQLSKPNRIHIECQPARVVSVTLRSASGRLRAGRSFARAGGCALPDATFRKHGTAVNIAVGDIIRSDLASDARVVWPHLAVSWTGTAVSVRCLPSSPVDVRVFRAGVQRFATSATTDAGGHYDDSATGFTALANDALELTCATAKGDRITFTDTVP